MTLEQAMSQHQPGFSQSDVQHWQGWVGRSEQITDVVSPTLRDELYNVLQVPGWRPRQDSAIAKVLPPGAHWLLFNTFVPAAAVGADGHPIRGRFLPPIPLPRRMWAGGRIDYLSPLHDGAALTRSSRIEKLEVKAGSDGPLVFVTVQHTISSGEDVMARERQDLVYMNIFRGPSAPAPAPSAPRALPKHSVQVRPDEVMLFRYSALTRNAHRIHYDLTYAQQTERYPALVVHGPLTATLLQWFAEHTAGRPLRSFEFRGLVPLFLGDAMTFCAAADSPGLKVEVRTRGGEAAMRGHATF
jgi:3-methylfumaryl-CoA hydratase